MTLCLLVLSSAALGADAPAQRDPPKRVLIVSTGSRLAPGFITMDQQLLQALRTLPSPGTEIYTENLDIVRFPTERSHRIFSEYLSEKYAARPPDLVILVFVGSLGATANALTTVFPDTPIIVAGFTEEDLNPAQFSPSVTGLAQRVNPEATLALVLRLQPDLRRLVVIGGTAEVDRHVLQRVRAAARTYQGRISFEFWDNMTVAELGNKIATLPADTAVLYGRMFRDAAGQALVSSEVGQWIGRTATAPVYLLSDPSFGTGAVGGAVASVEAFGKRAGELARRILTGTRAASLPFEIRTETVPMVDWRALARWGIDEERLPPNAVIRFKPQSIWAQYGAYAAGALGIMLLQAATIAGLVLQRRRLRHVQAVLQQNQQLMELATDAGELGLWSRPLSGDTIWANASMRALFGFGACEALRFEEILGRLHPDDRDRVVAEVETAEVAGLPFQAEFRTLLPDGTQRWVFAKGRTLTDPESGDAQRMGVVLDITERKRAEESLRESEDNFRRLVESTRVVSWQADPDTWDFTYVSPSAVELLGYPLERWHDKDFWISHIHPDDRERAIDTCLTMSRRAHEFDFEYRMIRASGEVVWVHDIVNCTEHDKLRQLRGLMLDITERKRAEEHLRESEERFRAMANAAPVLIWMSLTDGRRTFFNNGWLAFTGRTLAQELGNGWTECVHQEDLERCVKAYVAGCAGPREFTVEYRLRRHDGEYRDVMDHGVPRFESDGTFLGYIGTCIDVTERKQAQESLDRQRAFLRQVIDVNPNFIFAKNREGRFTLANQAVADAYGVTVDELVGKTDADFDPNAAEVENFRRTDLEVMNTRQERFIPEECITDAQGNVRWLQTVKRPIIGRDGSVSQVLGASTDITRRKRTEIELQELRADLAHVARISLMGELAASLAHELNQPLTAIHNNAKAGLSFMTREPVDLKELGDILEDIVEANDRAAGVIRRMRTLVKKDGVQLEFVTLDLASLVRDIVALVQNDALIHNIRIVLELHSDLPMVRGDRVQLQQVVLNLVLNAFDAVKESPVTERAVRLRVEHLDGTMNRVAVADRGPGLTSDQRDKIFQPFYTTKREGLGMGLSICRSIVEAHGGSLWAENNADRGATFYFTVPVETRTSSGPA